MAKQAWDLKVLPDVKICQDCQMQEGFADGLCSFGCLLKFGRELTVSAAQSIAIINAMVREVRKYEKAIRNCPRNSRLLDEEKLQKLEIIFINVGVF